MRHITKTQTQTIALGKRLAKTLRGGDVVCLYGDLGAGKTTLVKGIAAGLGITKTITSPTFLLMRVYKIPKSYKLQASHFVHVDCYRVHDPADLEAIGLLDYLGQPDTITIVEWPERMTKLLPKNTEKIMLRDEGSHHLITT
jgi:tRNA threonylcarbamoyladenosine biosynthesis protein TsaE